MADRCPHGSNPPEACTDWVCVAAAKRSKCTVTPDQAREALETLNAWVTYGEATFKVADKCNATIEAFIKENS